MKNKKALIGGILIFLIALGLIFLLIIGYFIMTYNNLVTLDQGINSKWSEVENQYQRQADLIPNLVSVVSSAVKIETKFITDVTDARSKWQSSKNLFDKDSAGVQMNNGIAALVTAVSTSENYPTLQANKQYVALTDELSGTQNRITVARGRYIEAIGAYNIAVKKFPSNLIANMFGFKEKEYYKADVNAMQTPKLGTGTLP